MHKNSLVKLVEEIFENLIERINTNENPSKEQVINYLTDAIEILSVLNDNDNRTIDEAKGIFTNVYKDIMNDSLASYGETNDKFDEIAQLHEKTLQECIDEQIDINTLTSKFGEIQSHMTNEIKKANEKIASLTTKVKVLEQTSNIDPLTKVFNRRALNTYLQTICSTKSAHTELHVLMIDVDNFKIINDTYGHITGDKILIFLANILKKTLRDGDRIFRFGGEEFVVTLSRNSDSECELVADRLLKLISANNLIYMGEKISVTVSIGLTKLMTDDIPDSLLSRADKALYSSKFNGKNQISKVFE